MMKRKVSDVIIYLILLFEILLIMQEINNNLNSNSSSNTNLHEINILKI